MKKKLGILSSGNTNLVEMLTHSQLPVDIGLIVLAKDLPMLQSNCEASGIPTIVIDTSNPGYNTDIAQAFWEAHCDLILTCNFTRIITEPFLSTYFDRIINIHPSLLPAFTGNGNFHNKVIEETYNRGCTLSGCSAYLVDEGLATGPILGQFPVNIDAEDDIEIIKSKINNCYIDLLTTILDLYADALEPLDFSQTPELSTASAIPEPHVPTTETPTVEDGNDDYYSDSQKVYAYQTEQSKAIAVCDKGLRREENMDTVLLSSDLKFMAVADGVGSADGGKHASRIICQYLQEKWNTSSNISVNEYASWLDKAIADSNDELLEWNHKREEPVDLGSTLVAALVDYENNVLHISNTGDSRAYLWRDNKLYRLTQDHSEDYDPYQDNNGALIHYIGGEEGEFDLDLYHLDLCPGDRILLCSDGLLYATEDKVAYGLQNYHSLNELKDYYLQETYAVDAPDNIGIVVLDY